MLEHVWKQRAIPDVMRLRNGGRVQNQSQWRERREEILDLLRREIYGYSPKAPENVRGILMESEEGAFAGKARHDTVSLEFETPEGSFCFPVHMLVPKKVKKPAVFLHIAFRPDIPDRYLPVEEILDEGYAIANFCYEDVSPDKEDGFATGLPAAYPRDPQTGWGKISVWAWAASRVMDYLCTREDVDSRRVAVIGHSRLGKTALWCGAQDERISMVVSNDSGCAGAALFRQKTGEHIEFMSKVIPYWFCGNYCKYAGKENSLPFDQHFLLALAAPRALCVGSAAEDAWADPWSEFLSCAAASEVFELLGQRRLQAPEERPRAGQAFLDGKIAYQIREGSHFFSRTDWLRYIEFRKLHHDVF